MDKIKVLHYCPKTSCITVARLSKEWEIGTIIAMPKRAGWLEYLWALIKFRAVPTMNVYKIISIIDTKIEIQFLRRM